MKVVEIVEKTTKILVVEEEKPPRVNPRIKSAPKIRQLYWCDFPKDAQLPEFWKTRSVLIMSFRSTLYSAVTVLPCSGQDQTGNSWAYKLPRTIDGKSSWAICDKPTTFAVSRLTMEKKGIVRLTEEEFNPALQLMLKWLTPGNNS